MKKAIWISAAAVFALFICAAAIIGSAVFRMQYPALKNCGDAAFTVTPEELLVSGTEENKAFAAKLSGTEYSVETEKELSFCAVTDRGICCVSIPDFTDETSFTYDLYFYAFDNSYENHLTLTFSNMLNPSDFVLEEDFGFYAITENDRTELIRFSAGGKVQNRIHTQEKMTQLLNSGTDCYVLMNGSLFAVSENDLIHLDSGNRKIVSPCSFISENSILDASGNLFELQNWNLQLLCSFNQKNISAIATETYFLQCGDRGIYGTDRNSGTKQVYYNTDFPVSRLVYWNHEIYAGGYSAEGFETVCIREEDLQTQETPSESSTPQESTALPQTEPAGEMKITSETYSFKNAFITGISGGTTLAQFKTNINYENCSLSFRSATGKEIKSGSAGTGMQAVFANGKETAAYTLIITGDLTGEGNVNSLDLNKMFDFLLNGQVPEPEILLAGDLNGDGKFTNKDLVLLSRML